MDNLKFKKGIWELMILDGKIPDMTDTGCLAAGDIDKDGRQEIFVGGTGSLIWYRPETFERGKIDDGNYHVSIVLEDIDGDGLFELCVGYTDSDNKHKLIWYKPGDDLHSKWEKHEIDPDFEGCAHDILFADIDGDGENELLANSCYCEKTGIFAYKRGADVKTYWKKHILHMGTFTEGLCVGDITGNGRPDIVITDSEYMDGSLSWFENRLLEDPENPWIEHKLENGLIYSHSLEIKHDLKSGHTLVFVAEMDQGGWFAPYNLDARIITYLTNDHGKTWERELLYQGEGTHEAVMFDIDNDGEFEIVGKTCSQETKNPKLQIWKRKDKPALNVSFKHRFLDRDKPRRAIEIMAADVDGDGRDDVVCGAYWYKNPSLDLKNKDWRRYEIPGFFQVINHYDIDMDGRDEFIAMKWDERYPGNDYMGLMSQDLWWIKPIDPINGLWEEHYIGKINGDWAHGSVIAPLLPNGKLALITCYHDSQETGNPPELFAIPDDPKISPWPKRVFADVRYNEELIAHDMDNDGVLDVAAGQYWFENNGDGTFTPHPTDDSKAARIGVFDINKNGMPDIVIAQEDMDYPNRTIPFSQLFWLENPGDKTKYPWRRHVIDTVRCAHSLGVADIDGDGEAEIVAGEHDPFWPYRKRCRIFAYKKADEKGTAWYRHTIDGRFEHHDGAKIFEIEPGKMGIISHGWEDKLYVHLWEVVQWEN